MAQAVETIPAHSERSIQEALYFYCNRKHHRLIVPNVQLLGWESDFVSVTANDYLCEYEIKISRSDFRKDLLKTRHHRLINTLRIKTAPQLGWIPDKQRLGAVYLYYVTPADLVKVEEVPEHAGLLTVSRGPYPIVVKPAPRLHNNKLTDRQRCWLERSLTARYWNNRIGRASVQ
jgi:hypothetical protein